MQLYEQLRKCLPKTAVGLHIEKDGKKYYPVITQCPKIIEFFNSDKVNSILSCNDEIQTVTGYEITLDKVVTINVSDVQLIYHWSVPFEIAPPLYLLPQLSGYVTDEQLYQSQMWFFERVKKDRDRGCFSEESLPENVMSMVGEVKVYMETILEHTESKHPLVTYFKDWHKYGDFNLKRNIKDSYSAVDLYRSLYFIPAIQACLERNLDVEHDLEKFLDESIFIGLKEKWIDYLIKIKNQTLLDKREEFIQFDNDCRIKMSDIFRQAIHTSLMSQTNVNKEDIFKHIVSGDLQNFTIKPENWRSFLELEGLKNEDNSSYVYSDALVALGVPRPCITAMLELMESDLTDEVKGVLEKMKQDVDEVLFEYRHIQSQYEIIEHKLNVLEVEEDLKGFDDYRIYLRYWPESFDYKSEFHDNVRPFTEAELYLLRFFIKENINFDYDKIYRPMYDYYNSLVEVFEPYFDEVVEKRLAYIKEIAEQRSADLKNEMEVVELTDEEKEQFEELIKEITDVEKYRKELKQEKDLLRVLAYWPVSLYPVPEDIFQL